MRIFRLPNVRWRFDEDRWNWSKYLESEGGQNKLKTKLEICSFVKKFQEDFVCFSKVDELICLRSLLLWLSNWRFLLWNNLTALWIVLLITGLMSNFKMSLALSSSLWIVLMSFSCLAIWDLIGFTFSAIWNVMILVRDGILAKCRSGLFWRRFGELCWLLILGRVLMRLIYYIE